MTLPGGRKSSRPNSLRGILDALGLPTASRNDLLHSRKLLQRRSTVPMLPPLITATAGRPTRLDVGASKAENAQLKLENGETRNLSLTPVRGRLRVPAISETGYHRLQLDGRELVIAVAPSRCHTIDDTVPDARLWGIAAQVYALRHARDAGIGDASGIADLAAVAGARGADALALIPLHALFGADPARLDRILRPAGCSSTRCMLRPNWSLAVSGLRARCRLQRLTGSFKHLKQRR